MEKSGVKRGGKREGTGKQEMKGNREEEKGETVEDERRQRGGRADQH